MIEKFDEILEDVEFLTKFAIIGNPSDTLCFRYTKKRIMKYVQAYDDLLKSQEKVIEEQAKLIDIKDSMISELEEIKLLQNRIIKLLSEDKEK